MALRATIRTAGTLAATLLCAAVTDGSAAGAFAQTTVNQVQLGDVFSQQALTVDSAADGAAAATTSVGNSAIATGSGVALVYQGSQDLNAEVAAKTNVSVAGSGGPGIYASTSATGNTGTTGTCCATTSGSAVQSIDPYHGVSAETYVYAGGYTGEVSADSTAIGNTQGWEPVNGQVSTTTTQKHYGTTVAETGVTVGAADTGSYSATAVGNNVTTDADNSSTDQTITQIADGYLTQANVQANQGLGGDVTAVATANANNINVAADGGSANLDADQLSTKPVDASATVNLDSWYGSATVVAYGVANSALVSNNGSSTGMSVSQNASGPVTVTASLTGGTGGDAYVSATGVGNAVSGYACASCNGVVRASSSQTSSGGVNVTSTLNGGSVNSAGGAASAIGNTATFVVQKPGG